MRQQFIHKNYHQWHRTCSLKYTGIEEDKGVSHCHGQVKRDAFNIIPLTLSLSPARLCRNEGNAMLVILNEVKNLIESIS